MVRKIKNRFELLKIIGYGGMATVYLARDNETGDIVAVKIMDKKLASSASYIARFEREISIIEHFNHPYIPHLIDKGVLEDDEGVNVPFIIMEYVQGITLREYIKKIGAIPVKESLLIAKNILSALSYAYSNGVKAHRDIKPENIMINPHTKAIKVMDFGIAKTVGSNLTHSTVLFTPYYASPEQLLPSKYHNNIDSRTDIYSLGIVIYEMMVGKVPYDGETPVEIASQQLDLNSSLYEHVRRDIPSPISDIILKCIHPNRDNRYQTPEEVISAIDKALPLIKENEILNIAKVNKQPTDNLETTVANDPDRTVAYKGNDNPSSPSSIDITNLSPEQAQKLIELLSQVSGKPQQPQQQEKKQSLPSPWPMFRGNPQHTGLSPFSTANNKGKLKWKFKTNGPIKSSPAIAPDSTIYVGSDDKYLYAISPDGTLKWKFKTGDWIHSSPAISSDGTIYIGSDDRHLYAVSPDGMLEWKFKTRGLVKSSPAISPDGTIYIGSHDRYLYALNPDGTLKWEFKTGDWVRSSPAISSDGTIYIGSYDRYLYALNPNGTLKWKFKTGYWVRSSPAISSNGTIYVGSDDGHLYAISPDGTLKWRFKTNGWVQSSPAIGPNGTIYVGSYASYNGYVYAISVNSGLKWVCKTNNMIDSSPAVTNDGTICIGSDDRYLYLIDSNGKMKQKFLTDGIIFSSPAIAPDGTIYIGSSDGYLYAIG